MPVCGCSAGPSCPRTVEVGGATLTIAQQWHPRLGAGGDAQRHTPPAGLGTCVWEGALALLRALELSPSLLRGKTVLELGCGTGLVALACAALGARRVVATDNDATVLALAKRNVAAHPGLAPAVAVQEYAWGGDEAAIAALGGPFDLVIGADITYDLRQAEALREDFSRLARTDGGRLVLAFARRAEYRPELLLRALEAQGWRVLWPLAQVQLEERDAPAAVLDRWAPLGICVAHAVRQAPAPAPAQPARGERAGGERKRRKWATTDFESGAVVAAADEAAGAAEADADGRAEGSDGSETKRGRSADGGGAGLPSPAAVGTAAGVEGGTMEEEGPTCAWVD
eukprot:COSAG04_NODE_2687_length_3737_cov_193.453546_3_plen_342_part_00